MKKEISFVNGLIKNYPRSSNQINLPFQSDAEIVKLQDNSYIATSLDAVVEEISLKLLRDPKSLAWLTVTASISDLAAVGIPCDAISVFLKNKLENALNTNINHHPNAKNGNAANNANNTQLKVSENWKDHFIEGVKEAAKFYQVKSQEIIVSDGKELITACTAYGFSKTAPKLSRIGLNTGDTLFLTGPIGWGNAVAFANFVLLESHFEQVEVIDKNYRPIARIKEALLFRDYSHVCIDTSDGLLCTLKWLEILNRKKIYLNYSKELYHPLALDIAEKTKVNPWLFMAAQNGEFELLFSVSAEKFDAFKDVCQSSPFKFLKVGTVAEGEGIHFRYQNGSESEIHCEPLLDMLQEGVEPEKYVEIMLQFAKTSDIKFRI